MNETPNLGSVLALVYSLPIMLSVRHLPREGLKVQRIKQYWKLPGGKIHPGETPEQAAIRETLEETQVDLRGYTLTNLGSRPQTGPAGAFTQHFCAVQVKRSLLAGHEGKTVITVEEGKELESTCFEIAEMLRSAEFFHRHKEFLLHVLRQLQRPKRA